MLCGVQHHIHHLHDSPSLLKAYPTIQTRMSDKTIRLAIHRISIQAAVMDIQKTEMDILKVLADIERQESLSTNYSHCYAPEDRKLRLQQGVRLKIAMLYCEVEALKASQRCKEFHLAELKNQYLELTKEA